MESGVQPPARTTGRCRGGWAITSRQMPKQHLERSRASSSLSSSESLASNSDEISSSCARRCKRKYCCFSCYQYWLECASRARKRTKEHASYVTTSHITSKQSTYLIVSRPTLLPFSTLLRIKLPPDSFINRNSPFPPTLCPLYGICKHVWFFSVHFSSVLGSSPHGHEPCISPLKFYAILNNGDINLGHLTNKMTGIVYN